jgi:YfiH family protein
MTSRLPQPNQPFAWVQAAGKPALCCRPLRGVARHLFTTREWRLGSHAVVDDGEPWTDVAGAMDADPGTLVRLRQVHGSRAVTADAARSTLPEADIIVNRDPNLTSVVQAADCAPLLLADRRTGSVGAAHAGWRGMAARAPQAAVNALDHHFDARARDLLVAVGPSIGACCYEVGDEVRERFVAAGFAPSEIAAWFRQAPVSLANNPSLPVTDPTPRAGRWFFDGWSCVRDQLVAAGVPLQQIYLANLCTASHPNAFPSYRRDGRGAGRLAAAIRPLGHCEQTHVDQSAAPGAT